MNMIGQNTVKKIVEILQLPESCTGATIRLEPNNLITLEVTSVVCDETLKELCEVLKKFQLVEVRND